MARRILIVDDDADIRELTRVVLSEAGFEVVSAGTGEEALRLLVQDHVDLILLDLNMPGMSGWQTLRVLKSDPELSRVAVVLFSVRSEMRERVHGMQDGAVDYIMKPYVLDELVERVERIFENLERGSPVSVPG